MQKVQTVLEIPEAIAQGLASGTLTRIGGVVRNSQSGSIVALLRETATITDLIPGINLAVGILNLGASLLNLGVSVIGFTAVINRLGRLEQELITTREVLLKSNEHLAHKIHLSFYANFSAALKLADNAFMMSDIENRRVSAMQAINRFLEAEEHFVDYAIEILEGASRGSEQYLLTLALAYVAEARCYLELEDLKVAHHRLQEGITTLRPLAERYVDILLTPNPCAYLHPELTDEVTLSRLTKIYQWRRQDPSITENDVFQEHRQDCFSLFRKVDQWKNSLSDAVWEHMEPKGFPEFFRGLPKVMTKIEIMIESCQRLESYAQEVQIVRELGLTFRDWSQLTTIQGSPNDAPQVLCTLLPESIPI